MFFSLLWFFVVDFERGWQEVNWATPDGGRVGRAESLHYDANSRLLPTSLGVLECVWV